jgi:hypothetical protein
VRSGCAPMMAVALSELSTEQPQGSAQDGARLRNGRFAPGHSGNPHGHKAFLAKQRAREAHEAELLQDIIAQAGGELSAVDMAFAKAAAELLAKAAFDTGSDKVRFANGAAKYIALVRNSVAARRERSPVSAFDQYVQQKAAAR